ncbi:cytochrome c biogenesis protein CcsA [Reichenbachiella ulvae]|uniref:Cytochrome c biogenesis protein CcsA n=1 Tax=Reichenbachiella ulvae TaxID=2980104 RepID=A0ABT3CRW0_9BACT|nr:cytochrome c biogenesis protein CcsA [Reichenbachiella ulvae]MCV9386311.1 cytochrome c biogenesis protein CcsA [Reichenbachiella ulvae]
MIGDIGHLMVVSALVSALVAAWCYSASTFADGVDAFQWKSLARKVFYFHVGSVVGAVAILFAILYGQHYEYQYAYKHSSSELPFYYILSCFWEGQEGSFLIWIFWNALVGLLLLHTAKIRESSAMMVLTAVQSFFLTMIVGVYITGEHRLGSSAFLLLKDTLNDPIYQIDAGFVPKDGTGLNPLLQNIWMVIHPPFIFLGFAICLVPFSYGVGALISGELKGWVRMAQIWSIAALGVLGLGIMMGAYWAYETLNFGGYWNWDPVENAVLIPWLVLLGAVHGLMIYSKRKKGLFFSTVLVLMSYILVVYSTFLTRSGILGDSSVHSFTDLGLSGQLVFFLLFVLLLSGGLLVYRWRDFQSMVSNEGEFSIRSFDYWTIVGIGVFCLSAFQILLPTSMPVFSAISDAFGMNLSLAPPADPVAFYSKFQIGFAILFGLVMGMAQLLYWKRADRDLEDVFLFPATVSLVLSAFLIFVGSIADWRYILLVISTSFMLCATGVSFIQVFRLQRWRIGSPLMHFGFAVMLLGILFSSGYSKIVSKNITISSPNSTLPEHTVQEHALLNQNVPKDLGEYKFTYQGALLSTKEGVHFSPEDAYRTTMEDVRVIKRGVWQEGVKVLSAGDTVHIDAENTFYQIKVEKEGKTYYLKPRMQNNPNMGYVASPDTHSFWGEDLYVHVSNFPDPAKKEWKESIQTKLKRTERVDFMGLSIKMDGLKEVKDLPGLALGSDDLALGAELLIDDGYQIYSATPIYLIKQGRIRLYSDEVQALGLRTRIESIDPKTGEIALRLDASQRDWITIKAKEFPHIQLVWIGTLILFIGAVLMVVSKIKEGKEASEEIMSISYKKENKEDWEDQAVSRSINTSI